METYSVDSKLHISGTGRHLSFVVGPRYPRKKKEKRFASFYISWLEFILSKDCCERPDSLYNCYSLVSWISNAYIFKTICVKRPPEELKRLWHAPAHMDSGRYNLSPEVSSKLNKHYSRSLKQSAIRKASALFISSLWMEHSLNRLRKANVVWNMLTMEKI